MRMYQLACWVPVLSSKRDVEYALPQRFYSDPSNNVEEVTKLKMESVKRSQAERLNKGRRIRLLVRNVMKGKNFKGGSG